MYVSMYLSKNKHLNYRVLHPVARNLTVNNNTFCFATIYKVFYYVASVLTTCFGPYIRPSSSEFTKY
jgi:hypothetical protein